LELKRTQGSIEGLETSLSTITASILAEKTRAETAETANTETLTTEVAKLLPKAGGFVTGGLSVSDPSNTDYMVNGDFSEDLDDTLWKDDTVNHEIVDGRLRVTATGDSGELRLTLPAVNYDRTLKMKVDCIANGGSYLIQSSGGNYVIAGKSTTSQTAEGIMLVNAGDSLVVYFRQNTDDTYTEYDNISFTNAVAIDGIEVANTSNVAGVLTEAKEYTDTKVAALVDGTPELLDTLKELGDAIGNDENFAITVANNIAAAKTELTGAASEAMDTMEEIEVAVNAKTSKASNLSDLADVKEARTNLDVMSTQEVNDAISGGATTKVLESIEVDGDSITLSLVPVNGVIENFGMVRFINDDGTASDVTVTLNTDDDSNKVYTVEADKAGKYDTKTALVQYTGISE